MATPTRPSSPLREAPVFPIDWGDLAPLRLRARAVAEGVYAGAHPSVRKGAGVEFGGYRAYTPGDDLRFLDRRALLRHDRLVVREFETETDRAVWLVVDATASMAFRGDRAPGAKLAYAALVAAAIARVSLASGDPVGLAWLGGEGRALPAAAGREAYERILGSLEDATASGDLGASDREVERALSPIARRARRGAAVVLISDLLDLPPRALEAFTALSGGGRILVAASLLDPAEVDLDFHGHVRLRALEGGAVVETDADQVREAYKTRLAEISTRWSRELEGRRGRLVRATTAMPPVDVVRAILLAITEAGR